MNAPEALQQAWQRQALDAPRISLDYLRHQTQSLQRRTKAHLGMEYLAGIVTVIWVVWSQWNFIIARPLSTTGIVLWIGGIWYILVQWKKRAGTQEPSAELGTLDALQFYRRQLERQRDARRGNWRWWVPALVPCLVAIFASLVLEVHPVPWIAIGGLAAWVVFGMWAGIAGYERAARGYQREIDALDSMK